MRGFECKNLTPIKAKEITEIANVTRITAGIIASAKSTTAAAAASRITIVFATVEFRARNRSMERNFNTKVTARRNLGMKIPHGIEEQTYGRDPSSLAASFALTGSSLKQ
jgi:hypothetical protein